ncbi:MAG: MBL fold metallo-hydrolase [Leptolyngbyaceae cyanobacterium SM1_1_3]|nr:MBL fold metallo-hydrolase [Leptolyngbyaceae cyanobacterium SM1_1_3]NJN01277.1 MBL fold metallo-hydrolase [Leptolyngbyaceae cyanobacterium RM1_1_2]NJO10877.1 MBL fold metallo-hydrolase [Leptolyngbyaceae cyanobacterium SL_1_1]
MSNVQNHFLVKFWGVRGSIACPGNQTVRYGGNTSCVEMQIAGQRLVFDGGTGLRELGQELLAETPVEVHMFFTHSHWDHIQGFPFFVPAFVRGNKFSIYGAIAPDGSTIEQRLNAQMLHPNFPVPLQIMGAELKFCDLEVGEKVELGDVLIENALLNHPGEAVGYRVSWNGHSVAYITDTEHLHKGLDENVLRLARDADLIIYDATYTDEEYRDPKSSKVGWGHSTWQEAVKVAKAARAKQLVIFHHDPLHSDDFMDEIGRRTAEVFPNSVVAREGMVVDLLAAAKTAV